MAKKERRRAHRQTQRKREAENRGKPTLRRSIIMGAFLGLAYFLLMEYVVGDENRSVWVMPFGAGSSSSSTAFSSTTGSLSCTGGACARKNGRASPPTGPAWLNLS